MPKYKLTDQEGGDTITIEADQPPTQADAEDIFKDYNAHKPTAVMGRRQMADEASMPPVPSNFAPVMGKRAEADQASMPAPDATDAFREVGRMGPKQEPPPSLVPVSAKTLANEPEPTPEDRTFVAGKEKQLNQGYEETFLKMLSPEHIATLPKDLADAVTQFQYQPPPGVQKPTLDAGDLYKAVSAQMHQQSVEDYDLATFGPAQRAIGLDTVGKAFNTAGRYALAGAGDIANLYKGQASLDNLAELAANPKEPTSLEQGLEDLHGWQYLPTKAYAGAMRVAPQLAATALTAGAGAGPMASTIPFWFDEKGVDPVNAMIAMTLPGVSKYGEELAAKGLSKVPINSIAGSMGLDEAGRVAVALKGFTQKLGPLEVTSDRMRTWVERGGGIAMSAAYLTALKTPEIMSLPADKRADAAMEVVGAVLGPSLMGFIARSGKSKTWQLVQDEAAMRAQKLWEDFKSRTTGEPAAPTPDPLIEKVRQHAPLTARALEDLTPSREGTSPEPAPAPESPVAPVAGEAPPATAAPGTPGAASSGLATVPPAALLESGSGGTASTQGESATRSAVSTPPEPVKALPDVPSAAELLKATPEEMMAWKKRARYDARSAAPIAAKMTGEDIDALKKQRDELRAQEADLISKADKNNGDQMMALQIVGLKGAILNEIIDAHAEANPPKKEKIVATAVKNPETGKITSAPNKIHIQLYNEAGMDPAKMTAAQVGASSGFITDTGRFVNQEEAGKISGNPELMGEDVVAQTKKASNEKTTTTNPPPANPQTQPAKPGLQPEGGKQGGATGDPEVLTTDVPKDIAPLLNIEVPDVSEARTRVEALQKKHDEHNAELKVLEAEIKAIEPKVLVQKGPRWNRGKIKASAKAGDLKVYREANAKAREIRIKMEALTAASREDAKAVNEAKDKALIADPKRPFVRRLDRLIRSMEPNVPKDLIALRKAEVEKIIKSKYPDATAKEVETLANEVERGIYFDDDPWTNRMIPDLNELRRKEIIDAIPSDTLDDFPEELKSKLTTYRFAGSDVPKITRKDIASLKKEIDAEHKTIAESREADRVKAAAEAEAEKAREEKLIEDAEKIIHSVPFGSRTAKEIKAELVARIKEAIDETIAQDAELKLTRQEGGGYAAHSPGGLAVVGEVEPKGDGFKVSATVIGEKGGAFITTVKTVEEAEWVFKALAAVGKGKAIIAVPGDGLYKLWRMGRTLMQVWKDAKAIATTSGTEPSKSSAPSVSKEEARDYAKEAKEFAAATEIDGKFYAKRGEDWWEIQRQQKKEMTKHGYTELQDQPDQKVTDASLIAKLEGKAPAEAPKAVQKYRIGNNPQLWTLVERLPQTEVEKQTGEQIVRVKNDKSGEIKEVDESKLTAVNERTPEQKAAAKAGKRDLDAELVALKMDPSVFPNEASKKEAIKRAKALAEESRVGSKFAKADIFEMDDGDLADLMDERFGTAGATAPDLGFGRTGRYTFPDYPSFQKWMDERYKERDLEGMKEAFAEADSAAKVRFIKDNKGATDHKRAWIANLATGAVLPAADPPIVRTTPRPLPGGGYAPPPGAPKGPTAPPPGSPPPRPGAPPPPPRAPTIRKKFDVMALVQLFRQFSRVPTINSRLKRALGRLMVGTGEIELKERLMWDKDLAERVLGHEIGHFIDLIVSLPGKGMQFAQRLAPLKDFSTRVYEKKALRAEAVALSVQWRGPFSKGDKYRDTARELMADFMSAMFHDPEWVNQNYHGLYDHFQQLLDGKPQFKSAYRELEVWLSGGTMAQEFLDQQDAAVKRTMDELLKEKSNETEAFRDWLKGATMSIWYRAYDKEGRPTALGESITDDLEYNNTWAARQNALFRDDVIKQVIPELAKVDPDPIKARALFTAYTQAVRTIGERRAAGVWIEQHPTEARAVLQHILNLDAILRGKYSHDLLSARNDQIYDLAAQVARSIHDRGEPFVKRMAREIDDMHVGVDGENMLIAFNVRGKLMNPGGLTAERAQQVIDLIKDKLTPPQMAALVKAAEITRKLFADTQRKAYDEGLISKDTWDNLIEPNQDNHITYAVLDYFDGRVRAGIMPQKGTARDIADTLAATQLKVAALNVLRQKARQVQLLRDAYAAGGAPVPLGKQMKFSEMEAIRKSHPNDDISRTIAWSDGKTYLVEFDGDAGKSFEKAINNPGFYEHMAIWAEAGKVTHSLMQFYTTFSLPFLLFRNPLRGLRTGANRVGYYEIGKQVTANLRENLRLARNYAAAAFGAPMLPEIRDMVESEVLLPPHYSRAMLSSGENLRELVENGAILANDLYSLRGAKKNPLWLGGQPGREVHKFLLQIFNGYEAFEKIYNYRAALEGGASEDTAVAITQRSGIPKQGVGGHWTLPLEVFLPWTRVHIQGMRATLDTARDKNYRKGFFARLALTEGLPRLLKVLIGAGVVAGTIKWLIGTDEDPDDGVLAEALRRISPYKMALDDVVPFMLYDSRTGQYHYFTEFKRGKDIPKHFEVVSLRLPSSEEGRLWGTLLYGVMTGVPGAKEKLNRPGKNVIHNVGDWAVNYLAPNPSPVIRTGQNLYDMIALGKNPEDPFRGQPSANQRMFDAGGTDRAQAIAGYTLNQLGGPGDIGAVIAMNLGLLDQRAADALTKRLATDKTPLRQRFPVLKNMWSYDNYASYRDEKNQQVDEKELRNRSKMVMTPEVASMYDFYYRNLARKDKLDPDDALRFEAAKQFVQRVWGDMKETDIHGNKVMSDRTFYGKAAHALGPDGSKMAKETLKRDLDQAAAPYVLKFKDPTAVK